MVDFRITHKHKSDSQFHPLVYEINTRCWLRLLSIRESRAVTLATVPDEQFVGWREFGFTHIWAMGVWTTGPRARSMALKDESLRRRFEEILPGWKREDVAGSPYAISDYRVPDALGGDEGLQIFRKQLHEHGLKLLLDFVPNHLGIDHPWVAERPEIFVRSTGEAPGTFSCQTSAGPHWLAHGRDPNFPPWHDTAQIDYRRSESRAEMIGLLQSIALRCDGVRCEMAMLLLNEVFSKTWANVPFDGAEPASEFWAEAIASVRKMSPDFLFLAEAYWGLEAKLQSLGFDFVYDKAIYDALVDRRGVELQKQLATTPISQRAARTHFVENHDERRIASVLSPAEHRAALLLTLGLPGMRLIYEGQLEGWRRQAPVHLGRWPDEKADDEIRSMYLHLLATLKMSSVGRGEARLLHPEPLDGSEGVDNIVIIQWRSPSGEVDLVVVNLAGNSIQCRVRSEINAPAAHDWEMRDLLGGETSRHHAENIARDGVCLNLCAHAAHVFRLNAAGG